MMKRNKAGLKILLIPALFVHAKALSQISLTPDKSEWNVYIKGLIQNDFMVTFQDMGLSDGFASHSIEIPQHNAVSSNFSVKQSQIGFGIQQNRSDTGISGYVEIDFYGPGGTTSPRFRHGYIQWKKWLAGQTWSNFSDVSIFPTMLDFVPPDGIILTRKMQIRYSDKISPKSDLSLALESPDSSSITLPSDSLQWKNRSAIPSFSAMYRYGNDNNYIKAGAILSPISYDRRSSTAEEYQTRTIVGWGGLISGKLHSGKKDIFSFQSSYGKGISNNNSDLNGEHYDAIPDPSNGNLLKTLALFNIVGIYEHWWTPKWSSVAFISHSQIGSASFIPEKMTKNFQNAGFNIIFHPYQRVKIGIEANYGERQNFNHEKANAVRIQSSASVQF